VARLTGPGLSMGRRERQYNRTEDVLQGTDESKEERLNGGEKKSGPLRRDIPDVEGAGDGHENGHGHLGTAGGNRVSALRRVGAAPAPGQTE